MNIDACMMSEDLTWETPMELFDKLDEKFQFTLDPCCLPQSARVANYFTPEDDGLIQDWGNNIVFMNPPYGREIKKWMEKAVDAWKKGATVVCLVPARVDTSWWWNAVVETHASVTFIKGRLKFGNGENRAKNSAPFPSALIFLDALPDGTHHYIERKHLEYNYDEE